MYDYYLGGSHNFAVDRAMAERGKEVWPELPLIMRENRAYLRRAVRYLSAQGVTQFLDLGSGIPTVGNVHEIAQEGNPGSRVVYVDRDPIAVNHGRAILAGNDHAAVLQADVRDPDRVLADPDVRRLIDFDRPVAVLLVAVLHFVADEHDPAGIIARFRAAVAPGSYLALSHFSSEGPPERVEGLVKLSRTTPEPLTLRSRAQIEGFLTGLEIVDPGVVYLPLWRPDSPADVGEDPEWCNDFAGVGRKPA